ncbi:MAG TPA: hopanoid biosynthesis-associated protein HpnK [Thermoanaerobaculia bacterium]|nr:hopanoid biosynthesis-associated protein HpnK [Thermoanaerobaculia bacterium]
MSRPDRRLIVTADDFGLSVAVNEAIERAHTNGVLTSASLMMAEAAADDAVARARRLPSLRVGLHVSVVDGRSMLTGEPLPNNLFAAGVRYFVRRKLLEREIRAQFEAFARTGLPLDHADAHHHMHCHPTVFATILRVGRDYGLRAIRIPREPFLASWRASRSHFVSRLMWSVFLWPWLTIMRLRARRAGLTTNDAIFGMNDTGAMSADRFVRILEQLPPGTSEIYFHPRSSADAETDAVTRPEIRAALQNLGIQLLVRADRP